jgi:hypothetical protein
VGASRVDRGKPESKLHLVCEGGGRTVVMTPAGVRLLQVLHRRLHYPSRLEEEVVDQAVTAAAWYPPVGARVRSLFRLFAMKRGEVPLTP